MSDRPETAVPEDFSFVMGGPLYQLLLRARLARAPLELLARRLAVLTLLVWLPLMILSALEGHAFGGVPVPFLKDIEAQVRLLVALPLLILAERVVHMRFRPFAGLCLKAGIVRAEDRPRFDEAVASTTRWRNSVAVEVGLLAFAFAVGPVLWVEKVAVPGATWFGSPSAGGRPILSLAGHWYAWVSLPVFQFLLLRWWYRLVLYARLLWRISRLDLDLSPHHPDRTGGIGFFGLNATAFAPLLVAQSSLVAAMVASRILGDGAKLQDFKLELGGMLVFALLQALGPLLLFGPALARAQRRGWRDFSLLGDRYAREFDRKWIHGGAAPGDILLGSSDIQSLADLEGSFDVVRHMHLFPFGKEDIVGLAAATALPGIPLLLTVMPLEEIVKRLMGALL